MVGVDVVFVVSDCMVIAAVLYRCALSVPFLCQCGGAATVDLARGGGRQYCGGAFS